MFICNHCPFVKHVADELAAIGREYMPKGIGMVAINSNDVSTHRDSQNKWFMKVREISVSLFVR